MMGSSTDNVAGDVSGGAGKRGEVGESEGLVAADVGTGDTLRLDTGGVVDGTGKGWDGSGVDVISVGGDSVVKAPTALQ